MLSFLLIVTDINRKKWLFSPKTDLEFFFPPPQLIAPDVHLCVSVIQWILQAEEIWSAHVSILLYNPSANEVALTPARSCAWGNAPRSQCPPFSSFNARVLLFKQWYSGGWGQQPPPFSPTPWLHYLPSLSLPLQHICKKQLNRDQHQMGELFVDNNNAYTSKNCTCANVLSSLTPKLFSILFYPRRCW